LVRPGAEEGGAQSSGPSERSDLAVSSEKKEDVAGSALVVLLVEGKKKAASEDIVLLVGDCGGSGRSMSTSKAAARLICGGAM
jgi:hypothetical protein